MKIRTLMAALAAASLMALPAACKKSEPANAEKAAGAQDPAAVEDDEEGEPAAPPTLEERRQARDQVLSVDQHMAQVKQEISTENYKQKLAEVQSDIEAIESELSATERNERVLDPERGAAPAQAPAADQPQGDDEEP